MTQPAVSPVPESAEVALCATVQIGNSDDKLSQVRWSEFVQDMDLLIARHSRVIHFRGGSGFDQRWQNAAWIFEIHNPTPESLRNLELALGVVARKFWQEAIAVTYGETKFIGGN